MKKILFIIVLINVFFIIKAQDYYAKDLPEYTAVADDSTDVFYIDDSGVDKHIEMPTLIQLVSDSTNQLRSEVDTAKTNIRSEIAGGGAFSATGDMIDLTSADDSLYVGDGSASEKFEVDGNAVVDTLKPVAVTFLPGISIYVSGDNLVLDDLNNTATSLSGLIGGSSYFSKTSTTLYPTTTTDNMNIGGSTATAYKLKVTGDANVTTDLTIDDDLYVTDYIYLGDEIWIAQDGNDNISFYNSTSNGSSTIRMILADNSRIGFDMYYNGSLPGQIYISDNDTLRIKGKNISLTPTSSTDSVFLRNYAGGAAPFWFIGTVTGAIDTGTLTAAGFALDMKVLSAIKRLKEAQDGEIRWFYTENGEIKSTFEPDKLEPMQYLQALQSGVEMNVKNAAKIERNVIYLKVGVLVFFLLFAAYIVRNERRLKRFKDKSFLILNK